MATNKHAMIRYQALDACFANRYRRFYIEDLIEACNKALQEFYLSKEDPINDIEYYVKRRTIFNDIAYMQSEEGWSAPIKRYYVGHRCYYRYEVVANFEDKLGRKKNTIPVIGYDKNPYLTGIENLSVLYNHIVNKQVLRITYKHFTQGEKIHLMHPYYLKQYNNRWFLFGITEQNKEVLTNLALDRIVNIELTDIPYILNTSFDFEEYFEDVVGVSVPRDGQPEKVVLKISEKQYPYIITKPLHPSQTELDKDNRVIQLTVFQTWELESLIASYGDDIEVIEPVSLREKMRRKIENLYKKYNCAE